MTPAEGPTRRVAAVKVTAEGRRDVERLLPVETPVAIVADATTFAVMMATPSDLEDFATGFLLTEGLISSCGDIREIDVAAVALGVEARVWLQPGVGVALTERRRRLAGPTGCGLCGVESLAEAVRPPPRVQGSLSVSRDDIRTALEALAAGQALGQATRASHAAGLWRQGQGLVAVREDVGRHNALDKLAGALARAGDVAPGLLVLTSRVSVEMVQKAARLGAPVLAAVSAPTTLALEAAEQGGITVVAVARSDGFEIFTHPERIVP